MSHLVNRVVVVNNPRHVARLSCIPFRQPEWGELGLGWGELSELERSLVAGLGKKHRSNRLREAIVRLLSARVAPLELASVLGRDPASLVEDHLGPVVREARLKRRPPDPAHPAQAYRTADGPLFSKEVEAGKKRALQEPVGRAPPAAPVPTASA
ncbi:MAG: hypothetical protein IPK71_11160 [Myxococcales bacterium]|nr:hypothetical protein [Myxococcales bacterium]